MTLEQQVVEKLRELSPEKQKEVLAFLESLQQQRASLGPRRSLLGLWQDLNTRITEKDIAEARREMWGEFPRPFER